MGVAKYSSVWKLDGVGPVDNRPFTNKLHHLVRKKERKKMWHVTCDTWHVWGGNILSNFQLPSSYRLRFMMLWRSGGKGWVNQLINDEAVYRTAPATPGLLNISNMVTSFQRLSLLGRCFLCVNLSICVSVCLSVFSLLKYLLNVFLPPLPQVLCPKF